MCLIILNNYGEKTQRFLFLLNFNIQLLLYFPFHVWLYPSRLPAGCGYWESFFAAVWIIILIISAAEGNAEGDSWRNSCIPGSFQELKFPGVKNSRAVAT